MTAISFTNLVLVFAIYSIAGWACEVIYHSIKAKKLVRRGFLAGPYCPLYGFGALALILPLRPLADNIASLPLLFVAGAVITSALVYFTSWFMEKVFNLRWWDYSHHRIHLNGRISLPHSILSGVAGAVMLYAVQPFVWELIQRIPPRIKTSAASLFVAVLLLDLVITLNGVYQFDAKLKDIRAAFRALKAYDENYAWYDKHDLSGSIDRLHTLAGESGDEKMMEIASGLRRHIEKDNGGKRLLASFQKLKSPELQEYVDVVKQAFQERRAGKAERKKTEANIVPEKSAPPVPGLTFYKLFWIFFIGCIAGYVIESLYCLAVEGHIESRQGLIYGPFSQVYGFGAVLIVVVLNRLARKGDIWVFIGSAVTGGAFEVMCSLAQENMFGSVSWDYTGQNFAFFGGRTTLLFMFFWGILGVVFIRKIYPPLSRFVDRIQGRRGTVLSWILIVFMALDMGVSALAVHRWSERVDGMPPRNTVEAFIDERYPDNFLEIVYPNFHFRKNDGAASGVAGTLRWDGFVPFRGRIFNMVPVFCQLMRRESVSSIHSFASRGYRDCTARNSTRASR
ncbi:MAG: putative ABC transporter permease [Treponema sp.]|jgi:uncharacterized membrane protein|nr:putative ABC transporter permease [Treponema sp.]